MESLSEPDLLVMVLVLRLREPGQEGLDGLDVLYDGPPQGGVLAVRGHGQDRVQGVVVRGAQAAHDGEQFPKIMFKNVLFSCDIVIVKKISLLFFIPWKILDNLMVKNLMEKWLLKTTAPM